MMSKVRGKDTKPEMRLRRELWARGCRYRLHDRSLPGRPDIVFRGPRLAVFVDSDWWHGRILLEEGEDALRQHLRTKRQDWWVDKLKRNVERDHEVTERLREMGWRVLRIWTSEINDDVSAAADRVIAALSSARPGDRG